MTDLPPPNPEDAWSGGLDAPEPAGPGVGERMAIVADRTINWVNHRRRWWATPLLWLLGFMVLLPLLVVARARGSRNGMIGAGALLIAFVVIGATSEEPGPTTPVAASDQDSQESDDPAADEPPSATDSPGAPTSGTADASANPSPPPTPSPSPSATPSPSPSSDAIADQLASPSPRQDDAPVVLRGAVASVTDGDTLDMADGTTVRIAIVDAAESDEPCGPEATAFTRDFVAGEEVVLHRPVDGPQEGSFGRTLGELVRVSDGASLNVALVAAGLGTIDERFTGEDPDLTNRLRAAQSEAGAPSCARPSTTDPAPEPAPSPQGTDQRHGGTTTGGDDCHPAYHECLPIVDDLDCGQVGHQVTLLGNDDPYRLDGRSTSRDDGDGCESESPWSPSATYPYY